MYCTTTKCATYCAGQREAPAALCTVATMAMPLICVAWVLVHLCGVGDFFFMSGGELEVGDGFVIINEGQGSSMSCVPPSMMHRDGCVLYQYKHNIFIYIIFFSYLVSLSIRNSPARRPGTQSP